MAASQAVTARGISGRASIDAVATEGLSFCSPTLNVLLNGIQRGARAGSTLPRARGKNIKWAQGGTSYDWDVRKYRSTASKSTGEFGSRTFTQPNLYAQASESYYINECTWGIGEGDLEKNRHAGPHKIRDIKKDRVEDAIQAVQVLCAKDIWAANETDQNGGLTMFSPTNAGGATTYAGIAFNASETVDGTAEYYWRPLGYDYGTKTFGANLIEMIGALKRQIASTDTAAGGTLQHPDFGVGDPTLWPYILLYFDTKASFNLGGGNQVRDLNLVEADFENLVVMGITIFPDDYFGGSTGWIDASATEELLIGCSNQMFLATTHTQSEGLIRSFSTVESDMAIIKGQGGVFRTGAQVIGFRNPKYFQILYT